MTIERGRCPPAPPVGFAAPVNLETIEVSANLAPWVRIFWDSSPALGFAIGKSNRFDPLVPPWQDTRVLYAGTSLEAAVAETLLRWHGQIVLGEPVMISEAGQLYPRRVVRFEPTRPLNVIDATGLGLASIEAAVQSVLALPEHSDVRDGPTPLADDIFQCGVKEYGKTQKWGAWFRSQCPHADGIQWVSRQYNVKQCLVLFEDRCGGTLRQSGAIVPLYEEDSEERDVVTRLIRILRWGVE